MKNLTFLTVSIVLFIFSFSGCNSKANEKNDNAPAPSTEQGIENIRSDNPGTAAAEATADVITVDIEKESEEQSGMAIPFMYDGIEMRLYNDRYAVVNQNGKWGIIDNNGKEIVPFDNHTIISNFEDGLAYVKKGSGDGSHNYYDETGQLLADYGEYDKMENYREGLIVVCKNNKYGFIDKKGDLITELEYSDARKFSEGMAVVSKNGNWGFIDKSGTVVIPLKYDHASIFMEGLAAVRNEDGKYGFINNKDELVIPFSYDSADDFSNGLARVQSGRYYNYIDKFGNVILPGELYNDWDGDTVNNELIKVSNGKKWGCVNTNGDIIIPVEYNSISEFYEDLAAIQKDENGKGGYINKKGEIIIPFEYDIGERFDSGLVFVGKDEKYYFLDASGNIAITLDEYEEQYTFSNGGYRFSYGYCRVKKDGKYGVIDTSGKIVVPIIYEEMPDEFKHFSKSTFITVTKDGKKGFVNKDGKEVFIENSSDLNTYAFNEGITCVVIDKKHGLVDETGEFILPLEYDSIGRFGDLVWVNKDGKWGAMKI